MKNSKDNHPPVVIRIMDHYGSSGKWKLQIDEYLNSNMKYLTQENRGYYKSDKGVVDKALKRANKYAEGEHIFGGGEPRPVQISISERDGVGLSEEQRERIDDKFLEEMEAVT